VNVFDVIAFDVPPVPNVAVPLMFLVGAMSLTTAAVDPAAVAGQLLRTEAMFQAAAGVVRQRRVGRSTVFLVSLVGLVTGLAVGALSSLWVGLQGWFIGVALSLVGVFLPPRMFDNGWRVNLVQQINNECLGLLQMVYVLSGVGGKPVDQAVRTFAQTWRDRSVLARILGECPPTESPVDFLAALDMPGQQVNMAVLTLRQAKTLEGEKRERTLAQRVKAGIATLKHEMEDLARRRTNMAIIVGVVILLPTLMIAILAPPLMQVIQQFSARGALIP
jgi:hypothetical protein